MERDVSSPLPPTDPDWIALLLASALGVLGRLYTVANADCPQRGWRLAWELMLGIPLGIIGWGLGHGLGLGGHVLPAVTVVFAITGRRGVELLIEALVARIRR